MGRVGICCVAGRDLGAERSRNLRALGAEQTPRIVGLGWGRNWAADLSVHGKQLEEAERAAGGGPACHPGCPRPSRSGTCIPSASSYLAVGSWAGGFQGPWWPLEEEEKEEGEEGTVPPLPCGGGANEVICVPPQRGKSPGLPGPDTALCPVPRCHVEQGRAPIVWSQGRGRRNPHPRDRGAGGHRPQLVTYSVGIRNTTWLNSQEPW